AARVRNASSPSVSTKASSRAAGAGCSPDAGARTTSASTIRLDAYRRDFGESTARVAARDLANRLPHDAVEQEQADDERHHLIRQAEDQDGEDRRLHPHAEAHEDGRHRAFHDAEATGDERHEREEEPDAESHD